MTYDELLAMQKKKNKVQKKVVTHPEEDIQREFVRWFRDAYPELAEMCFHPNNEPYFGGFGKTEEQRIRAGARAKSIGVTPGVADIIILVREFWPMDIYPRCNVLCIEFKTKVGRQSDAQKEWQQHCEKVGNKYVIARSVLDAQRAVRSYITQPPKSKEEIAIERIFGKDSKVAQRIHKG